MEPAAVRHDHQRIVGREREQALLNERVAAMLAGRGSVVLIGGPAGIGKTTLVRDLVDRPGDIDVLVLAGGSYDLTTTPPYGPWIEALSNGAQHPALPDIQHLPLPSFDGSAGTNPMDHAESIDRFLVAASQVTPLVVVLEDIHWADPASLDLLRFVGRRAGSRRLLLVATFRSDELTPQHRLSSILPALVRESHPLRIDLRPLGREAIGQLVRAHYDLPHHDLQRLADYLDTLGSGNPLYIQEMLRTLEADGLLVGEEHSAWLGNLEGVSIPPLIQQTIDQRLSQLSGATRDALADAAVIGQDVPVDHWLLLSGMSDADLAGIVTEAAAAHVLEEHPTGTGLRFSHALVRESMYRSLPLPLRRTRHLRAADLLSSLPDASPFTVAFHYQQAGDPHAVEWFVRAGLRARTAAAWFSAADAFASAAEMLQGIEARTCEYGWLRFEAGFLQRFSGDPRSIEHLDAAELAGLASNDGLLVAYSRYSRGAQLAMRGLVHQGLQDIARGVSEIDALLETQPVDATEQQALAFIRSMVQDEPSLAARQDEEPDSRPRLNQQRGVLINWLGMSGRYREAVAAGEQFVQAFLQMFGDDYVHMSQCVTGRRGLGHAYAALGRPEEARRELGLARAGYRELRDYAILGEAIWNELVSVVLPYMADRPAERARLLDDAVDTWERCVGITIVSDGDGPPARLPIDMLEGRWVEAVQMARDHVPSPWIMLVQEASVTVATVARHQGDVDLAWENINQLFPQGPSTEPGDSYFMIAVSGISLAADLAMDAGGTQVAQLWIDMHQRWLDWNGARTWAPDKPLLRARLHLLSGEPDAARHEAEASLHLASELRQPLRVLSAHRLLGIIARQQGDLAEAETHLRSSVTLAEVCGAVFELALSQLELAEVRMAAGRPADARTLLNAAGATFERLRAAPLRHRVDLMLAEIDAQTGSSLDGQHRLTLREREVLGMVAKGLSNRQIANELFLSPRTVERHIANIYLKIDVHNKAEAVAYALQHDVI